MSQFVKFQGVLQQKSSSFPSHSCLCLIACLFLCLFVGLFQCLFFWLVLNPRLVAHLLFISYKKWLSLAHLLITKHHPVVDLHFCLPSRFWPPWQHPSARAWNFAWSAPVAGKTYSRYTCNPTTILWMDLGQLL